MSCRFAALTEQLPEEANRVRPDPDRRDAIGIPRPSIAFEVGEYSLAGMAAAHDLHERLFDARGATQRNHADFPFGAGHIMGTTKMGADPRTSVADGTGRCHDVTNLWIVGSSLFPTCGTANPTLTLAALALRTADALRRVLLTPPPETRADLSDRERAPAP